MKNKETNHKLLVHGDKLHLHLAKVMIRPIGKLERFSGLDGSLTVIYKHFSVAFRLISWCCCNLITGFFLNL